MSISINVELNKLCRTCASPAEDMKSIYETGSNLIRYSDMLMSSTPLKCYEDDGLPNRICNNCIGALDKFNKFKLKCLEVDETFRNTANNHFQEVLIKTEAPDTSEDNSIYETTTTTNCITTQPLKDPLEVTEFAQNCIKHEEIEQETNLKIAQTAQISSETSYTCSICNSAFNHEVSYTKHLETHTGTKPYTCTVCGNSFNLKHNLSVHMIRKHTEAKPYACNFCDSDFKLKESLTRHMRTHTGEKRFTCSLCDRWFTHKFTLVSHMRKHTGEKPYTCSVCGSSFRQSSTLRNHMQTHTGEKPYACNYCDSSFNRKGTLKDHIRTHTGEKPYSCSLCDCTFGQKKKLTTHMRKHT